FQIYIYGGYFLKKLLLISSLIFVALICFLALKVNAEDITTETKTTTLEADYAKGYDGIWFMGFNMHKDIFQGKSGKLLRQAIASAINRNYIATKVIGDPTVPSGAIPPGMPGYDTTLPGYAYDLTTAKKLLKESGLKPSDKALKSFTMVHTDGVKTIEIAKILEDNLTKLGIKVTRTEVAYSDPDKWERELTSGVYQLFLMGYKAENPEDTVTLLKPLFSTKGDANITYYRNGQVDALLDEAEKTPIDSEREKRLAKANRIILGDCPTVNLFYITKL
ncbi:MAG: ABC transporter substrate-binding protein, partial [bacterium]